jgi:type IV pilus assembly protein PilO
VARSLQDYPRPVQGAIVAALALAMAGGVVWYWLLPFQQKCTALSKRVETLHAQNVASRGVEQQRVEYEKRIAEQTAKLQALRSMVPDAADSDGVVDLVHDAESASGVHVRSLSADHSVTADEYLQLPFNLRVDGDYFGLMNFFERLGQAKRITNVTGLALGAPRPAGKGSYKIDPSETVTADFQLLAYCNLPPGAAPSPKKKK